MSFGLGLGLGLEPCGLVNITAGRFGPASGRIDAFCAPRRPTPGAAGRADSEYAECGGVSITDSVFSLSLKCIGSGQESRFFGSIFWLV